MYWYRLVVSVLMKAGFFLERGTDTEHASASYSKMENRKQMNKIGFSFVLIPLFQQMNKTRKSRVLGSGGRGMERRKKEKDVEKNPPIVVVDREIFFC